MLKKNHDCLDLTLQSEIFISDASSIQGISSLSLIFLSLVKIVAVVQLCLRRTIFAHILSIVNLGTTHAFCGLMELEACC